MLQILHLWLTHEKLCKLVSLYGRVRERRKLRECYEGLSPTKVMRRSRYENLGRMHARLNGKPLEKVDCFKYLWSQLAADGGCKNDMVHRLNKRNRA